MERLKISIRFLLIISVFLSCATHHEITEEENFHKFQKKFYRDSTFQYSRINFPLSIYINTNQRVDPENDETGHGLKEYTPNDLSGTIKGIDQLPSSYSMQLDTIENKIIEWLVVPRGSYMQKRFFILKNNQWYLDSIQIVE